MLVQWNATASQYPNESSIHELFEEQAALAPNATDAFATPPPGVYGNSGRNTVIGPGIIDWDFSAMKRFRFTERSNLEFRAEFFNIPNHPIFANPGLSVGTLSYGVIGGTVVESRQIQFALRLQY